VLTVAWDVDDVLNDLMYCWFQHKWLPDHPECTVRYEELTENPPHRLLGVSLEEYLDSLDAFRLSGLYQEMKPVHEVKSWFEKYGDKARHVAITAVPLKAASVSSSWVFKHFGVWIRTFHFVPSIRKGQDIPDYDQDKRTFLKWLEKASILVEDNETNIKDAENEGIKGVLIPRTWNSGKSSIKNSMKYLKGLIL
jgi:hypothetical protein